MISAPEEKPEGAPEWMVSFADMITIMMSFFVIMYAIASGEAEKGRRSKQQQAVVDSIQYRFGPKWQPFASWGVMPGNAPSPGSGIDARAKWATGLPDDKDGTFKVRRKERAKIRVPGPGQRTLIGGSLFFDAKDLALPKEQQTRLKTIGEEIAGKPQQIEIVGHTSDRPLPPESPYRDRWELAYAQCRKIAQTLVAQKIEPKRIRISVVQAANNSDAVQPEGTPMEDQRVDVYMTDLLTEKLQNGREGNEQ